MSCRIAEVYAFGLSVGVSGSRGPGKATRYLDTLTTPAAATSPKTGADSDRPSIILTCHKPFKSPVLGVLELPALRCRPSTTVCTCRCWTSSGGSPTLDRLDLSEECLDTTLLNRSLWDFAKYSITTDKLAQEVISME